MCPPKLPFMPAEMIIQTTKTIIIIIIIRIIIIMIIIIIIILTGYLRPHLMEAPGYERR